MKVLFIGGTGNISGACTRLALQQGIEVYHLNRGNRPLPDGVISIVADIHDVDVRPPCAGFIQGFDNTPSTLW